MATIKPQHLAEARTHASRRNEPEPTQDTPDNLIRLFDEPEIDVDMDITEIIPTARLAVLRGRCR